METIVFTVSFLAYISFVIAFVLLFPRWSAKGQAHKKFFTALNNILQETNDVSEQVRQLNLSFKKLSENSRYVSEQMRGPEDLLEDFLYILDTGGQKYLKALRIEIKPGVRQQTFTLRDEMRRQNPFSSLPSREANLMTSIDRAIDTNNVILAKQLNRELAQEMEKTHRTLGAQEKRIRLAYFVSALGVVLTIIFGIFGLVSRAP